jgi:hypothetical protein
VPDARRIYIATPDETRATTIGDLVVRAGLVEGWQWWTTPAELAVAIFDGGNPIAAIFDHLGRSETLDAVKIIRAVDRRVPLIVAYNGDHPEDPTAYDRERLVSAWIPRPVFLRHLVHVLELYGIQGRRP